MKYYVALKVNRGSYVFGLDADSFATWSLDPELALQFESKTAAQAMIGHIVRTYGPDEKTGQDGIINEDELEIVKVAEWEIRKLQPDGKPKPSSRRSSTPRSGRTRPATQRPALSTKPVSTHASDAVTGSRRRPRNASNG